MRLGPALLGSVLLSAEFERLDGVGIGERVGCLQVGVLLAGERRDQHLVHAHQT